MAGIMTSTTESMGSAPFFRLLDLPREIIRLICIHIYDPLALSQQDRLTWGIFSTMDQDEARQSDLASLIQFGWVSRKTRREARVVLFRCIRVNELKQLHEVVEHKESWGKYVRSIIIDLNMFDPDLEPEPNSPRTPSVVHRQPRSCWTESALLVSLIRSLPSLSHMSMFADASDDAALALFFSSLITHPSLHIPPPSTRPTTPHIQAASRAPAPLPKNNGHPPSESPLPISSRLRSFGWRQRAPPPPGFRQYAQVSTFVSTLHLIGHSYQLSTLVLDADMDEMDPDDVITVCRELRLRPPPTGEKSERVSLTLCGPIRGWDRGRGGEGSFLARMVGEYKGFKELFIDRPLRKSHEAHATTVERFITLLQPLSQLPHLRLLQVGSYTWSSSDQLAIVHTLSQILPSLLVVGLLNEQGQTSWWGLWRRSQPPRLAISGQGGGEWAGQSGEAISAGGLGGILLAPLEDGHLQLLEDEADVWEKRDEARMAENGGAKIGDVEMEGADEVVLPPGADGVDLAQEAAGQMSLKRLLSS